MFKLTLNFGIETRLIWQRESPTTVSYPNDPRDGFKNLYTDITLEKYLNGNILSNEVSSLNKVKLLLVNQ